MTKKMNKPSTIITVPDPEDARRRRLLSILLLGVAAAALLMLAALLVAAPMGLAGAAEEVRGLGLGIAFALLGAAVLYALNRYLSGKLAGALFVLLLIGLAAISDTPQQVVAGRSLLVFAIPILAAGVLLPPWASFVAAALSSLTIALVGLTTQAMPNVPAIMSFFVLALVAYLSARSLERALRDLRAANQALQAGADEYRQRLLSALSQAAQAVQRARTPDEVYQIVGDEVTGLGYHDFVFTLTDDRAHLVLRHLTFESAVLRVAEKLLGTSVQDIRLTIVPGGFHDQVISEGQALFSEHMVEAIGEALPSVARPLVQRLVATLGLEQAIYAPLIVSGEPQGIFIVTGTGLTEADVPAVTTFANQAAIALENAQLYEQAQRHTQELERHVAERTADLMTSQASTLNMMEDAEEARRIAEERSQELEAARAAAVNMMTGAEIARQKAEQANEALNKEIAERLRVEMELERSNEDLQQFAYVTSHDLQEPLRAISGYLQLLERRYADALDERAGQYIGRSVAATARMKSMINDLLSYSRVGTRGKEFEPTDVSTVLEQARANLQTAIEESEATITHDPLPTVTADSSQLLQLFQNLMGNAIKFRGQEPPRVHISAERVKDSGIPYLQSAVRNPQSESWLFSVRDNGIGIEEQYAERIFIIFQRLHTRDEYAGTGIGLAVCKKIVERHGGRVWVESQPGEGSTFYFTLPIREA